ncbi:MAG: hypothetical protein NXI32_12890, partial [bacterium]|nr:hypothetical protein [bacterium]
MRSLRLSRSPAWGLPTAGICVFRICVFFWSASTSVCGFAQEEPDLSGQDAASASEVVVDSGARIILSPGKTAEPRFLYSASVQADVRVSATEISQSVEVSIQVIQGKAKAVSLEIHGPGEIQRVTSESISSWAVRQQDSQRFLELQLKPDVSDLKAVVVIQAAIPRLSDDLELAHLGPGNAVGFDSLVQIEYSAEIVGKLVSTTGFVSLASSDDRHWLQSSSGGKIVLRLRQRDAMAPPIELVESSLRGVLHPSGRSVSFQLRGRAIVTQAGASIPILSGDVAVRRLPDSPDYRLALVPQKSKAGFELTFPETGSFPVSLDFVAAVATTQENWRSVDFSVAASAVVPITLQDFESELEFRRDADNLIPLMREGEWRGFLPATGRAHMEWKSVRSAGEGKLFFTTHSRIEASVGPGLLRQDHQIDYQILQGQLKSLSLRLLGPGEILDVGGAGIVGWKVDGEETERQLVVSLSQPITGNHSIVVRSQTPLGAFPVREAGLCLQPQGAIRHSGYVRISNSGSVRVEPTNLVGLTQLAPEQFPGEASTARQTFVYRFPSDNYAFTVVADRIQPEVNVTQLVLYQLSESDRTITADIEMDIREAAIREWDFEVPEDYSVVSAAGATVADYVAASESSDGRRNLKIVFGSEVQGRQLIRLQLEKNEAAAAGDWILPRIDYPNAKSIRGDIGVVGAPGFRIAAGATSLLVEKPLSYYPNPVPNLQQAFRIREPDWSATLSVEVLERSVQSDVFHLYSLSQGTVYGSALVNYFVTGAPVSEWRLSVPAGLGNVTVDGQDIRTWRRDGDTLVVSLHQPVMGSYTLLLTFEEKPDEIDGSFEAGQVTPLDVQGDRGFVQVVSPMQVEIEPLLVSSQLLVLDALELPAEFRLLSTAPALGTWQYTERPFDLKLKVNWFEPGTTATQVVEFSEAKSRVSADGELVTDIVYYVKSRGQRSLRVQLPGDPVRLWAVSVDGQPVTARQAESATLIPLPGGADSNVPIEVSLRLGKPAIEESLAELELPVVFAPVLKTQWQVQSDENHVLVNRGGSVHPTKPVLWPSGFEWLASKGWIPLSVVVVLTILAAPIARKESRWQGVAVLLLALATVAAASATWDAFQRSAPPEPLKLSLPILAAGELASLKVQSVPAWRVQISWVGLGLVAGGVVLMTIARLVGPRLVAVTFQLASLGLMGVGVLLFPNGAPWFFGLLTLALFCLGFLPACRQWFHVMGHWLSRSRPTKQAAENVAEGEASAVVTSLLAFLVASLAFGAPTLTAADEEDFNPAVSIVQEWNLSSQDGRLEGTGKVILYGKPGDRFVLLREPAVLTDFKGQGLRLSKHKLADQGYAYIISIPISDPQVAVDEPARNANANANARADADLDAGHEREAETDAETDAGFIPDSDDQASGMESGATAELAGDAPRQYEATFAFQVEATQPIQGIPVLTGQAAVQS